MDDAQGSASVAEGMMPGATGGRYDPMDGGGRATLGVKAESNAGRLHGGRRYELMDERR